MKDPVYVPTDRPTLDYPDWPLKAERTRWAVLAYTHEKDKEKFKAKRMKAWFGFDKHRRMFAQHLAALEEAGVIAIYRRGTNSTVWETTPTTNTLLAGQLVTDRASENPRPMTVVKRLYVPVENYRVPDSGQSVYEYHHANDVGYEPTFSEPVVEAVYGEHLAGEVYERYEDWLSDGRLYAFPEGRLRPPTREMVRPYFEPEEETEE